MKIGNKVRERRKSLGLTLEDLADQIQSSKSYIWEIENKEHVRPTADKLVKLADALNVRAEYFLDEKIDTPSASDEDQQFFRKFEKLNESDKEAVSALINVYYKNKASNR